MASASLNLPADYWQTLHVTPKDIEFLQTYLFEHETPLTPRELVGVLVVERLRAGSPAHDDPWIDRIESERQRLLRCQDLLAGTFESGHTVAHACTASKPPHDALLLYHLVREFRPQTGLELGTNLGVSCAYQAAAMHVNGTGRMVTVERSLQRVEVARDLHARLGLNNVRFVTGSFAEALDGILRELVLHDS